jgi:4-hydroxy-tetrahydrodipicolinate synthase
MKKMNGVLTALITPFENGKVDYLSLEKLIHYQVKSGGIDGFVINGTTAESPTISEAERKEIFSFVQARVPPSFPLVMGTGSNSTQKTIEDSKEAERLGADAILVVVPYYNKPPQRGLLEHYKGVASATQIPTILYNVPSRTITSLELETIKKLSEHPNIIGIKEASGNVDFAKQIRAACGKSFLLLSGDDGTYDDFMATGGDGVISVASHILPREMKEARASTKKALIDTLFVEANPIPLKMALKLMGIIKSAECRLPLVEFSAEKVEPLRMLLRKEGLIS